MSRKVGFKDASKPSKPKYPRWYLPTLVQKNFNLTRVTCQNTVLDPRLTTHPGQVPCWGAVRWGRRDQARACTIGFLYIDPKHDQDFVHYKPSRIGTISTGWRRRRSALRTLKSSPRTLSGGSVREICLTNMQLSSAVWWALWKPDSWEGLCKNSFIPSN